MTLRASKRTALVSRRQSGWPVAWRRNCRIGSEPGGRIRSGGSPDAEVPPISRDEFKTEVTSWAKRLEVEPREVYLTGMRRKWGSCSPRARLTFDTALLQQPEQFRREAIVHELLHLKVRNHGPLFRALLTSALSKGRPEEEKPIGG